MAKANRSWRVLPHGPIEKLSDRLWRIEGQLEGVALKRVMAVARRADGTLVVHNAIALGDSEMAEIEAWGPIETIVVPNGFHRLDAKVFADRYPAARVLCPAGAAARVSQIVEVSGYYDDLVPDGVVELVTLEGTKEREGAMIVRATGSTAIVLNDAVFNMDHIPGFTGFVLRYVTGSTGGPRVSRLMKWLMVADKQAFRAHLERLASLPELTHIVVSHHAVIVDDPAGTLRRVISAM